MKRLLIICLLAGSFTLNNLPALLAADGGPAPEKSDKKAPRHVPFHGKVDTLDKSAGTLATTK